jgi:hypothetical protein
VNDSLEGFFAFFWLVVVMVVVILAIVYSSGQAKALNEAYGKVARRFQGRMIEAGMFGRPAILFHHIGGASVKVDVHSTGGKNPTYYTQVHIAWPDRTTRCEVYPERFTSRVGKMLGFLDIEIGSPKFDEDFIIIGNSVGGVREVLTPEVQTALYSLRRMKNNDHIYMSIGGGKMLVKKLGLLRTEPELVQYIEAALDLYDRALHRGHSAVGIEFVSEGKTETATEVVCQICGEAITTELVHCRRCKTPHHEDCWEYFGGCSTFGCGERRYTTKPG